MVQRWNVCAIVFWRVVWYRAGTFLCMRSCPCPSWPWRGRRALDVVTSLGVAVARRGRGRGVRRLYVAVVWLRHADKC